MPRAVRAHDVRHNIPRQDKEIAWRLNQPRNQKLLKQVEILLFDSEKSAENPALVKNETAENKKLLEENMCLKAEIVDLKEARSSLTDNLLKHKPKSQLADAEIEEMYQLLRENISSWVDKEITTFENWWRQAHNGEYPKGSFFRDGNIPEYAAFLENDYKLGGEHLVQSVLQAKLQDVLFSNDLIFFALKPGEAKFIHKVEHGLSLVDPPRDSSTIKYLRSEVLKGFTADPEFSQVLENVEATVGQEIFDSVSVILPEMPDDMGRKERFDRGVLKPAVRLGISMKTSATNYVFATRMTRDTQFFCNRLDPQNLSDCTLIDVNTRAVLKRQRLADLSESGTELSPVLLLAPGLLCQKPEEPERCLEPSVVCVRVGPSKSVDTIMKSGSKILDHSATNHHCSDRTTPQAIASMDMAMKEMSTPGSRETSTGNAEITKNLAKTVSHQSGKRHRDLDDVDELTEGDSKTRQHVGKSRKVKAAKGSEENLDEDIKLKCQRSEDVILIEEKRCCVKPDDAR
ncbi:MAG: hypothetical protein Q9216_003776 [Gyalolechia sp. 2 TL-2023]